MKPGNLPDQRCWRGKVPSPAVFRKDEDSISLRTAPMVRIFCCEVQRL